MTSKERVMAVFSHQIPDRIPMWCGASPDFMAKARSFLNVKNDEEVLRRFHDDFRRVYSRYAGLDKFNPDCGPINGKTKSIFGIEREGIGYGQAAAHPLANAEIEEIHTYAWPSPDWFDVSHIREDALAWKNQYAVLGGEWCPIFHDAIDLLGMENMLILMYEDPDIVHAVLSHITDFYYELSAREFEAAQGAIDIFFIGNDLGSQTGPLLGEELFRKFLYPYLKRLADLGREYGLPTMMHCCGSYAQLMPALIESGISAVQSLQPITREMQPANLKKRFGERLILNGCIDSISVLINGSIEDTVRVTRETIKCMKPGGGYILSPSHDYLLEETPVENVLAMYDTCLEDGWYTASESEQNIRSNI